MGPKLEDEEPLLMKTELWMCDWSQWHHSTPDQILWTQFLSNFFVDMPREYSSDSVLNSKNGHRWATKRAPFLSAPRCSPCVPWPILQFDLPKRMQLRTPFLQNQKSHFPSVSSVCFNLVKMLLSCYPHSIILKTSWNQCRTDRKIKIAGPF